MLSQDRKPTAVGTIRGRHEMPVECYLIDGPVEPGQAAYDAAFTAAVALARDPNIARVALYYAGLTEITLGAVDGFREAGKRVELMRWDTASSTYMVLTQSFIPLPPRARPVETWPGGRKPRGVAAIRDEKDAGDEW